MAYPKVPTRVKAPESMTIKVLKLTVLRSDAAFDLTPRCAL